MRHSDHRMLLKSFRTIVDEVLVIAFKMEPGSLWSSDGIDKVKDKRSPERLL